MLRIAILKHEKANRKEGGYLINILVEQWRKDGHKVFFLYGTTNFIPADLLIVHVDLSVVPDSYLTFAKRYPKVVNGGVKDIRKSTFSEGILKRGDGWEGPVILKSNKNYGGGPERRLSTSDALSSQITSKLAAVKRRLNLAPTLRKPSDYKIYSHLTDVPFFYFYHSNSIIQKFRPEMVDDLYCVRLMFFLGDHTWCTRWKSREPIINAGSTTSIEYGIKPHPKIVDLRKRLDFEYGKFDYVVSNGEAILLDTNKTVGTPPDKVVPNLQSLSDGLYSFFD